MAALHDLIGRDDERRRLALLINGTRNSRGGAALVLGEPGIGKTALLDACTSGAAAITPLRVEGYESESAVPFGAVQRLVLPLRHHLDDLQPRQQQALQVACGTADGPPPDRFLVGLGMLSLLASAAGGQPIVCTVDDAHLVDPESLDALAFVARRIAVERIALLFATRDEGGVVARLAGVAMLQLGGLDADSGVQLLRRSLPGVIDPAAASAIVRATGGNPLALIDLTRDLSVAELSNLGVAMDPIPVGRHLEELYVRRAREAGRPVFDWILLAAADSTDNLDLLRAAGKALGLRREALDRAEGAGLVEIGQSVRFRHPLVRSAVYGASSGVDRRRVHTALAVAAERLGLPDLEAWHAARSAIGTDPTVANRLERAADLAARRGGYASRARVLSAAADLTPPGRARDARLAGAAEAAVAVGAAQVAQGLVDALEDTADPVARGRAIVVRCQITTFTADATAPRLATARLLEAAESFQDRDPTRQQGALLKAFEACATAEGLMLGVDSTTLGKRLAAGAEVAQGPMSVILTGLSALILRPYGQAVEPARAAFEQLLELPDRDVIQMGTALACLGTFLWDAAGRDAALERAAAAARDEGALQLADTLLWTMSLAELSGGSVRRAVTYTELVREVRRAMGYDAENVINAAVMAWSGAPKALVLSVAEGAKALGFGGVHSSALAAVASSEIAQGGYEEARGRLKALIDEPFLHVTPTHFADYVEAASRCGQAEAARPYAQELGKLAAANGSAWCRGVSEMSLALVSSPAEAETHHVAAIETLRRTKAGTDLGRAHLLYGEWLRRAKRRREAGVHLNCALDQFERTGAGIFGQRAQAELDAMGAPRVGPTASRATDELTAQEAAIARLAAAGHTNSEIAANMFLSPHTVDYHLRKVFQKLGLTSRRQLADRLAQSATAD